MGVFDLRCSLSGLPTTWAGWEDPKCSMLLLEEVGGRWFPLTPPVTGLYDSYGRIEQDDTPLATAVGARLTDLWESGALTADFDDLEHQRNSGLGGEAAEFLGLASGMVFNNSALHLGGNRVLPALWLDMVSREVTAAARAPSEAERAFLENPEPSTFAVFSDWLLEQGRPVALAEHLRVQRQRGLYGSFGSFESPAGVDAIVRWAVEQPGGLKPLSANDAGQFSGDEERSFARQAWDSKDLSLRKVVARVRPQWVGPWQEAEQRPRPQAPVRRYVATERYAPGEWVAHARFGQGQIETVEARKMFVRFGRDVRPLACGPA